MVNTCEIKIGDKVMVAQTKDDLKNNVFNIEMIIVSENCPFSWKLKHQSWKDGVTITLPKNYCIK